MSPIEQPSPLTESTDSSAAVTATRQVLFAEDDKLRPNGEFPLGYHVLSPYEKTAFRDVTLKKTKNGHRAKSGVKIERDISPKRKHGASN
jgi:hypothetical protein